MTEKEITKFEKEILLKQRIEQLETELKEFSDHQKKAYSPRLQKSIAGLENRILRAKKLLYNN
ncbi:hypothetical protein [Acinetobacter sp. YH12144]|uniref:hypothetical protein n=1 Tax=Acinetobacter sp. YH12144 TaxID=2601128 RepID=UPI0015D28AF7|nr:hypothetical protein [Acinetobacter sp. YH12144]